MRDDLRTSSNGVCHDRIAETIEKPRATKQRLGENNILEIVTDGRMRTVRLDMYEELLLLLTGQNPQMDKTSGKARDDVGKT